MPFDGKKAFLEVISSELVNSILGINVLEDENYRNVP